tara:strand:- start:228 stop:467 length:240 start_codon:yes stop_codon:yes gene_type:complete
MTQTEAILAHLQAGESITPIDALRDYGCFRLAARIKDLRAAGHDVDMVLEGDGEKKWARYSLRRTVPAYAADGQGLLAL